jgi:hypothetical protein
MKLLTFLKSNDFALYLAIASVLFFAPNTFFVFSAFSSFGEGFREAQAGGICLILSGAILYYTIKKNFAMAKSFSGFEMGVSIYYYICKIYQVPLTSTWAILPALGFSIILPLSVYFYSKEIDVTDYEEKEKRRRRTKAELAMESAAKDANLEYQSGPNLEIELKNNAVGVHNSKVPTIY